MFKLSLYQKIKKIESSQVFKNFIYLNFIQLLNYVFPFITFPYVSRIFSQNNYGVIVTAGSIATYLAIFTDFGFNLSATRDISKLIRDGKSQDERFSEVISTKIFIFIIFITIFSTVICVTPKYSFAVLIYLISLLGVFGSSVLFPIWYFQATNSMHKIAKINLLSRVIGVFLLFYFVRSDKDILLFVTLNSLNSLFIGVFALVTALKDGSIKLKVKFNFFVLLKTAREGFASFTVILLISSFTTFNSIILSLFCTYRDVAIYGVADKIIGIVTTVQGVLIQSVFPKITSQNNKSEALKSSIKLFKYNLLLGVFILLFINIAAPEIVFLLSGHKYDSSIPVLRILSLTPIIIAFSSSLSTYCFALKVEKLQVYAYLIGVIYFVLSNILTLKKYKYYALSINYLICEVISIVILYLFVKFYFGRFRESM